MTVKTILLAGPTASGKSSIAMEIAEEINGLIVNADALQVYDSWRVLTARPSQADTAQVPHCLYGHVDRLAAYSVGHWLREIENLLKTQSKPLVVVGGTGLYFTSLLEGLSDIPAISAETRAAGNQNMRELGLNWFQETLCAADPDTFAKLDQNNPARLQRAWEVLAETGKGLNYWHNRPTRSLINFDQTHAITLNWAPVNLNFRIDFRFDHMMKSGAIEECELAIKRGFDLANPSDRALGAREIIEALNGKIAMQDAVNKAKILTHQFAKRQRSWFRNKMSNWHNVQMSNTHNTKEIVMAVKRYIG